jgi:hypothetical protein
MEAILVVAADLGVFRAFRRLKGKHDSQAHLEPIQETTAAEQAEPITGRFPKAASAQSVMGDMTQGEQHHYGLEQRRRTLQAWADHLQRLLTQDQYAECWLAAAASIHQQLIDALDPPVRDKIRRHLPLDLARTPVSELLSHFE